MTLFLLFFILIPFFSLLQILTIFGGEIRTCCTSSHKKIIISLGGPLNFFLLLEIIKKKNNCVAGGTPNPGALPLNVVEGARPRAVLKKNKKKTTAPSFPSSTFPRWLTFRIFFVFVFKPMAIFF